MSPVMQVILASRYREFPEKILSLELARAMAKKEGRSIRQALNHCAAHGLSDIRNRSLQETLRTMSRSMFPETQMVYLKNCLSKMVDKLGKEFNHDGIDPVDAAEEMAQYTKEHDQ